MTRNLDEALVQGKIVPDGVLPALLVVLVVGKVAHDILVDSVESEPLLGTLTNGHHNEGIVAVRRLLGLLLVLLALQILGFLFLEVGTAGGRVARAIERRCLGSVARHIQVAGLVAVVAVIHVRRQRLTHGWRRRGGASLRNDAPDAEVALQRGPRRWRGRHRVLLARALHVHHAIVCDKCCRNTANRL